MTDARSFGYNFEAMPRTSSSYLPTPKWLFSRFIIFYRPNYIWWVAIRPSDLPRDTTVSEEKGHKRKKMSLRRTYTLLSSKNEICVVLRKGQFLLKEIQKYFTVTTNINILFWPLKYLATRNGLLHLILLLVTKLIIMLLEKNTLYYYCFAFT